MELSLGRRWLLTGGGMAAFLVVGLWTLPGYGITFDEFPNFAVGEHYARFWTSLDERFLDFGPAHSFEPEATVPLFDRWYATHRHAMRPEIHEHFAEIDVPYPWAFFPTANAVSGVFCVVFFHALEWLPPVDAHHMANVAFGAVTVGAVTAWTAGRYGLVAGVAAAVFLGSHPRFFAHAHNNVKDLPEAALFTVACLVFVSAVSARSRVRVLLSAVLWGLALGTKPNALFLPAVVLPWMFGSAAARASLREDQRLWRAVFATPMLASLVVLGGWPELWTGETLRKIGDLAELYRIVGTTEAGGFHKLPLVYALTTTPPGMIAAVGLGVMALSWRRDPWGLFCVTWLVVPVLRVSVPGAVAYDGIRHYLEFLPAAAILSGIGVSALVETVPRRVVGAAVAFLLLANPVWSNVRLHPYQIVYFNAVVGGLPGAVQQDLPWSFDYWGTSYREAVRWLDLHAEPGAEVLVPIAAHVAWHNNPREDLVVKDVRELPPGFRGYVLYLTRRDWYHRRPLVRYCERHLQPVHQISVQGVPLAKIFRLDGERGASS